jgi:hypothetical protein
MNKFLSFTVLCLFLLMALPAFGLNVNVDVKGPQELMSLKDGLTRTITARCLAKNVGAEGNAALNVSIFQMGSTISLDAILSSQPPKAFHRDLKSADEISGAIDAMIAEVFTPAPQAPAAQPVKPAAGATPREAKPELKLSFTATSLAFLGETLFVSSDDTVFSVENGKTKPWWKAPNGIGILRLYTYKDAILVVAGDSSSLFSYLVKDGKTSKKWNRCVIPSKDGLISSRLFTEPHITGGENHWVKADAVEGTPRLFPEGTDILSTLSADVLPAAGEETISFDKWGHLVVLSGKETLWTSDEKFSTLPSYVTTRDVEAATVNTNVEQQQDAEIRYYLMPRILLKGREMITIANHEGISGIFGKVKMYDGTRIVAFTPQDSDFEDRNVAEIRNNYCADITLDKGNVLALIVKKSTSYIQRVDLQ